MKQYIILFLLLVSQTAFAPNLKSIEVSTSSVRVNTVSTVNKIESQKDSISTNLIKKFKFNNFNKEERCKVREIANNLGIKEVWLYKVIYIESRGKTNVVNKFTNATGLIQFLPSTAIRLGTTVDSLKEMTVCQQLDYVEKYFKAATKGKKLRKFTDVYMAVFCPSCIGLNEDHVIGYKNSNIEKYNRGMNVNGDSTLTIKDVNRFVAEVLL